MTPVPAQGQDVEDSITEMQEKIFVEIGVAGSFGLSCLPRISTAFAHDQAVMQVLTRFAMRQAICSLAMMNCHALGMCVP